MLHHLFCAAVMRRELLRLRWESVDRRRRQIALPGDDGKQRTKHLLGRSAALTAYAP